MPSAVGIASLRLSSSRRIVGDLPPSSSVTRFIVAAPSRMMVSPTATEPVNEILSTPGFRTSSAPTTLPRPVTTLRRPFGKSASWRASINTRVCNALNSLGNNDSAARRDGRGQLEANEQRVRIPRGDQAGHADRLQGHRRLAPTPRPLNLVKRLFGRQKGIETGLHDQSGEPHDAAIFFDHCSRQIVEPRRSGLVQPAQNLRAFFLRRPT